MTPGHTDGQKLRPCRSDVVIPSEDRTLPHAPPRARGSVVPRSTGLTIWGRPTVAQRGKDWNEGLAADLRDVNFAREFLLGAIEDGVSVQRALGKVIRAMGVKEFAGIVRMASPNVLRAINPRHNPTQQTLNRMLHPFRLRLSLAPLDRRRVRNAAWLERAGSCAARGVEAAWSK
jgi:DNA-binding phage protein